MILFKRQRKIKDCVYAQAGLRLLRQGPIFIAYPESHQNDTVVLSHLVKASPERDRISIPSLQASFREKRKVSIIRQR